ncbi:MULTISPECIES: VC0807 family protein [Kitasatospora]|uniref:VC0807 family protein n=1 Tax=Kitasatospora TaxID=2063 RepID=UPI0004BE7663|nr:MULTISPECIES: VC0807 family protein [Kitasatospora]
MSQIAAADAVTTGAATAVTAKAPHPLVRTLRPLAVDIAGPLAAFYLLHSGLGTSEFAALAWSSAFPVARTVLGLAKDRTLNRFAALMLGVNLVGLVLTTVSGDARLMLAKEAVLSGFMALAILGSALTARPLMSAALRPFLTKGEAAREAAWDRLAAGSRPFRRYERLFSVIWGSALLAECVARVAGAFTLPVATMAWLSTVLLVGAIVAGSMLGQAAAQPMEKLVRTEAAAA